MLGKKGNAAKEFEKQARKRGPFEIGRDGTVEELRAAAAEAAGKTDPANNDHEALAALQKGAFEGFLAGRPGNLQEIIAQPDDFKQYEYYTWSAPQREEILFALAGGKDAAADIIRLALQAIPAAEKQAALDDVLLTAAQNDRSGTAFVNALIDAGANPNAAFSGTKGAILSMAAYKNAAPAVIRLLHKRGADFDDALLRVRTRWDDSDAREICLGKLLAYREEITGAPATAAGKMDEKMDLLIRQVLVLTEEVERLSAAVEGGKKKKKAGPKKGFTV